MVHASNSGTNELVPKIGPHDQATLLSPVVAKIDRVDIEFQRLLNASDVVVGDTVEQVVQELRVLVKIEQHIVHSAHGPGTFVQTESQAINAKTIAVAVQLRGNVAEIKIVVWIRKAVPVQSRLGQHYALYVADVLFDRSVPDNAKWVAVPIIANRFDKTRRVPEFYKMIAYRLVPVLGTEMAYQFGQWFLCKTAVPGHVRWSFAVEDHLDDVALSRRDIRGVRRARVHVTFACWVE